MITTRLPVTDLAEQEGNSGGRPDPNRGCVLRSHPHRAATNVGLTGGARESKFCRVPRPRRTVTGNTQRSLIPQREALTGAASVLTRRSTGGCRLEPAQTRFATSSLWQAILWVVNVPVCSILPGRRKPMSGSSQRTDVWTAGALYEPYVGRWSRRVAQELLNWLRIPAQKHWLDVGCGTGALTEVILDHGQPHAVNGIDASAGFVAYAKAHLDNLRVTFEVGDAQVLPFESASFDAGASGLVLNFVPQPQRAATEMARVVRPGGSVAAYVWDYAGKMELIRHFWDAAVALDPSAREFDEGRRFPVCEPSPLAELFESAGLQAVEVRPIDVSTPFRDFDDYWSPFLGGQGPAPGYAMSLSPERHGALRERVRLDLPIAEDGSIPLMARAWAVRGQSP